MYLGRGYHKTDEMEAEMANNESPHYALVIKHPETIESIRSMRIVTTFAQ